MTNLDPVEALVEAAKKVLSLFRKTPSLEGREHDALAQEFMKALAAFDAAREVRVAEGRLIRYAVEMFEDSWPDQDDDSETAQRIECKKNDAEFELGKWVKKLLAARGKAGGQSAPQATCPESDEEKENGRQ